MSQLDEMVQSPGLGDRIREARIHEGMTQGELAGTDYSVSYISAIERNKIRPSLRALSWLASRLNMNLSDLLSVEVPIATDFAGVPVAEDEAQAAIVQAQIDIAAHNYESARDRLQKVRDGVKSPSQRIQVNLLFGEACVELGHGDEAKDALEQNLILTRDVDPVMQEVSRNVLGLAYALMNMHMMALESHRQCLTAIDSHIIRDPSFELSVLNNLGADMLQLGQHDEAIKIFERASALGQRMLTPQSLAELYWTVSADCRRDGQLVQAQRFADMAAEHLRVAQNRQIFANIQSNLGLAYAENNDNDRAEKTLTQARDIAERTGDASSASMALASLSRVQLAQGATDKALDSARSALTYAEQTHSDDAIGRAHLALGEALSAAGKSGDADKSFSKGLDLLEKSGSPNELTRAYEHYADLLAQRGDTKRAFDYLKKARAAGAKS
jgi:HTH-type transcriptional regulator, quorum sensing regulator NprR